MIRIQRSFVPLAVALAFASPLSAREPAPASATPGVVTPSAQPAAAVVDRFHAALARGDTKGALALLADDALVFESGGVEAGKAEYARHHLAADAEFSKAVASKQIRRWGSAFGSTAWVATERHSTGTFRGRQIDSKGTETMVLRRVAGLWRIAHIHWSARD